MAKEHLRHGGLPVFIIGLFFLLHWSAGAAAPQVVINEVAWMGTLARASNEWIELYNTTDSAVDITGWQLVSDDGTPNIALSGTIAAHGYFLLERTSDDTIKNIPADQIYVGALSNSGEALSLRNSAGNDIDRVTQWFGGDNVTKGAMIRIDPAKDGTDATAWATATLAGAARDSNGNAIIGTPRAENEMPAAPASTNDNSATQNDSKGTSSGTTASTDTSQNTPQASSPLLPQIVIHVSVTNGGKPLTVDELSVPVGTRLGLTADTKGAAETLQWSLGDGTSVKGELSVNHTFNYPGTYFVTLVGESGSARTRAQLEVFAYSGDLAISEFLPNPSGADTGKEWLELENTGDYLVDLGGSVIETGDKSGSQYTIPAYTYITPHGFLVIPESASHLTFGNASGSITLRYPNGAVADAVTYKKAPEGESAIHKGDGFVWTTKLTPGFSNVLNPIKPVTNKVPDFKNVSQETGDISRINIGGSLPSGVVADAHPTQAVMAAPAAAVSQPRDQLTPYLSPDAHTVVPVPFNRASSTAGHQGSGPNGSNTAKVNSKGGIIITPAGAARGHDSLRLIVLLASVVVSGLTMYYAVVARRAKRNASV